jgi:hypothetical protein
MGLKDVLQGYNVPLPDDFDERFDIVMSGLRRKNDFNEKLNAYRNQAGGAEVNPNDFLNPSLQWFAETITSPKAQDMLRIVLAVLFFTSYLESIPVFGSVLSAALDVMIAGSKAFIKTIQKAIPGILGLIPLPYMNLFGLFIAAVFGFIVWPIVAMVAFSRQDFTAAVDSFVRVIPPPIGDLIADNFLEVNRMAGRINAKRIKLANDISSGFSKIAEMATGVSGQVKQGAETLAKRTQEVAVSTAAKIATATEAAKANVQMPGVMSKLGEAKSAAQGMVPTGIMNKVNEATEAADKVADTVKASDVIKESPGFKSLKEKMSFEPTPVKAGKKLSRKPRMKGKWKTRRNKFAKH